MRILDNKLSAVPHGDFVVRKSAQFDCMLLVFLWAPELLNLRDCKFEVIFALGRGVELHPGAR